MPEIVSFDGVNAIVLVDDGETLVDAQSELYSAWKRWCVLITGGFNREGLRYEPFFRTVAGDPIRPGKALGAHFFITSGALIRPYLGNHELTVEGNLWSEPGADIFTPATGNATVLATVERAADVYQVDISGGNFTSADRQTINETHDSLGEFTGTAITATVPPVITGTLVTEQATWLEDTYDAVGVFTGSAIVATVPAVITGTLITEQASWLEETYNAIGTFTGTVVVAEIEGGIVTGTLTPDQAIMLYELWAIQGLQTGIPLEVSPQLRRVIGVLQQSITYDSPTTGTTYVLRTG